jgi:transmembrane protein TMEM260 (protein O-mannosyltransferase)
MMSDRAFAGFRRRSTSRLPMPTSAAAPPDGTATTLDRPSDAPTTDAVEPDETGLAERVRRVAGGDRAVAVALGAGSLAVYVRSLLPGIGYSGDTAKWQFLGEVGGTPHPTGYPLYLILNRAWVHAVPVGELAWRVNLLSAVLGAATVATLFLLLRALGVRRGVAAATAATYAVTVTFWSQAVVAEVYTLHLFFLTAVTLCLVRWLDGGSDRWLLAGLGLYALSFGNHLGSVLALPGVAWLLWQGRARAFRPRNAAWFVLFAAVGAGQYAYLLWMTDVGDYVEQPVHTLGDILGMVTGGHFRQHMFEFGPGELVRDRLPMFGRLLRSELGVLLVPAAYGLARAVTGRHRAVAVHLLLLGVLAATYALNFDVLDVFVFFLPCYLVLAVFLGMGLDGAVEWVQSRLTASGSAASRRWTWATIAALAAIPLTTGAVNYPRASLRGEVGDAHRIERAIDAAGTDAVLITDNYADSEYLWYYLLGEDLGAERDLKLANQLKPRQVEAFFARHRGPLARIARPGTPIYTATAHQAWALAYEGLTVTLVADNVWRIER